jgi:hypothetical protein
MRKQNFYAKSFKLRRYEILYICHRVILGMPVFLDVHKVPFSEANLKELCVSPTDEFGVRHVNLLYNKDAKICFCLLEGPDIDAIEKHHAKVNIKCEWITEVSLAQPFQSSV